MSRKGSIGLQRTRRCSRGELWRGKLSACDLAAEFGWFVARRHMRISGFTKVVAFAVFAVSSFPVSAKEKQADISPQSLVSKLYRLRSTKGDPLRNPTDQKSLGRYFSAHLTQLYVQDQIDAKGEVGRMEADPLYYAQDFDITDFKVGEPTGTKDGVIVVVSFRNIKKPSHVEFDLIRTKEGWRVSDIKYEDGNTLRGILESKFP
jgi:hypothetical protein